MLNTVVLTKDQFMERAALRDKEFRAVELKSARIQESSSGRQIVVNDEVIAEGESFSEIARLIGAPSTFLKSTHLDLADQVIARLSKDVEDKLILLRNNEILASHPKKGPYVPATQVCEKLVSMVPEVEKTIFFDLGKYFDAQILSHTLEVKPKKDDVIRGGLRCLFSEFMFKDPSISAFSERLICLNGMTHSDNRITFKYDTTDRFMKELETSAKICLNFFQTTVGENLKKATETKASGDQIIRTAFNRNRVNPKFFDSVLAAHAIENDGTAYGVIQSFTRAANSQDNYVNRAWLQEVGGNELSVASTAHCPTCYSSLN
jgi:hypothetical protein